VDFLGALVQQGIGGIAQSAARIDDIVDQDADLAGNIADDIHDFRLARPFAALIDNGERRADAFRQGSCAPSSPAKLSIRIGLSQT
jgi:hypothetical protein